MFSDLSTNFFTNEEGKTLLDKFNSLFPQNTQEFDVIVGYFFISGFYKIYKALESVDKIKVLVGLKVDSALAEAVLDSTWRSKGQYGDVPQLTVGVESTKDKKERLLSEVVEEVANAPDSEEVEEGIRKFKEWINSGKLEVRLYTKAPLHAKVYIFTFGEGDRDKGRIITGSSNLTAAGLSSNLEFNVQLKDERDYIYAKAKFDELWAESVEISSEYQDTIENRTHISDSITPYELYLKFLYEYFKADLEYTDDEDDILPEGYVDLEYQKQAVINAKRIIEEYNGVFIADVVGLGKTFISTKLVKALNLKTLVLAPPSLLDDNNPGSWSNVFDEFGIKHRKFASIGKLDAVIDSDYINWAEVVVIDESHRFRNQNTDTYSKLAEICKGKKVILVSATPFNNDPSDLLAQIKLFQNTRRSTVPGVPDLDNFFAKLNSKLKRVSRKENYGEYLKVVRENSNEIRSKVLKYLMVRRTRNEIKKYYANDLKKQGLSFPKVADIKELYYQFNNVENLAFTKTVNFIKEFKYSRYTPLLYFNGHLSSQEEHRQKNMISFMKMLLVKRFESSIYAFKQTLARFIKSYENTIREFKNGNVYISNDYSNKLFELLSEGDDSKLAKFIEEEKGEKYSAKEFKATFLQDMEYDLTLLNSILDTWRNIRRDVKLEKFKEVLRTDRNLIKNKLLIFTESEETANYLTEELSREFPGRVLNYTGKSSSGVRTEVIRNFDAKSKLKEDKYKILVTTDVLAEGVNLHRANSVINYDIPWNPTRIIQRVGRINRVDTQFKTIYTYNFFPTEEANSEIKLREIAQSKINAFIELLGNDSKLLTEDEEIKSHTLFDKLRSKTTVTGEDEEIESELKYLQVIKRVKEENETLFNRIKGLPKKSRSGKELTLKSVEGNALISYFKQGNLDKFILSYGTLSLELGFFEAVKLMESTVNTKRISISKEYYDLLSRSKRFFGDLLYGNSIEPTLVKRGGDSVQKVAGRLRILLRTSNVLTHTQLEFLKKVQSKCDEGAIPNRISTKVWRLIKDSNDIGEVYRVIKANVSENFLVSTAENSTIKREEIILSLFIKNG